MSLNWKEIDVILREAQLCARTIADIAQPDFEQLLILLRRDGEKRGEVLRISHRTNRVVLHISRMDMPAIRAPIPRFMQLARARLRGGVIRGCMQYSDQRIVRIAIDNQGQRFALWVRLWNGAANTLLTDRHDTIIDAYFRRPHLGEMSGGNMRDVTWARIKRQQGTLYPCALRSHPYASYNEMADTRYRIEDQNAAHNTLLNQVTKAIDKRIDSLAKRQEGRGKRKENNDYRTQGSAELQRVALLLQQEGHRIPDGATEITLFDSIGGTERTIALNPRESAQQNAQRYFKKYKKRRQIEQQQSAQATEAQSMIAQLEDTKRNAPNMSSDLLRDTLQKIGNKGGGRRDEGQLPVGRCFYSNGFSVLVGRSAAESDHLMRKKVRGNDVWLHVRGGAGSSVFVLQRKGKSIPLEVLYDAATLAHHFSKLRGNASIDVYYTAVKHLRRAKHAPQGTFIPFHDNGLTLNFDKQRLARLQSSSVL